jgi:tetratricopeptide (TPR) repeat protein
LLQGDNAAAVDFLERAVALNPTHGDSHYYLGQALEAVSRHVEAFASFDHARDYDFNPFRTLSAFNEILRAISRSHDNVALADAELAFKAASFPRAPGFDLFLDYVHPTVAGNVVLAKLVFDVIIEGHFVGEPPISRAFVAPPVADHIVEGRADVKMQRELINLSMMMHQYERALSLAESLAAQNGPQLVPNDRRFVETVLALLPDVVALERREIVGPPPTRYDYERVRQRLQSYHEGAWGMFDAFEETR